MHTPTYLHLYTMDTHTNTHTHTHTHTHTCILINLSLLSLKVDTPPPKKPKIEMVTSPEHSNSIPTTAANACYNSNGLSNPHKELIATHLPPAAHPPPSSSALSSRSTLPSTASLVANSQVPPHSQISNHVSPQVSNSSNASISNIRNSSSSVVNQPTSQYGTAGHLVSANSTVGHHSQMHGQQHNNVVSCLCQSVWWLYVIFSWFIIILVLSYPFLCVNSQICSKPLYICGMHQKKLHISFPLHSQPF